VARFTGHSTAELMDLVHAGILEQIPGRRACQLTATSLRAWMTNRDPDPTIIGAPNEPSGRLPDRPEADGRVVPLLSSAERLGETLSSSTVATGR